MGQSIVLSEIKAEVPLQNENPSYHYVLWQQYEEQDLYMLLKCDQYFMTKDTGDFRQFRAVACREYTLPRDDESSQQRGWIQGYSRIGLVLEVTTSYLWGKHGIEIMNLVSESRQFSFLGQNFLWNK